MLKAEYCLKAQYQNNLSITRRLRSSMGYIGAKKIEEVGKRSKFIKITKAGFYESMVHSVETIKSTTNYKL